MDDGVTLLVTLWWSVVVSDILVPTITSSSQDTFLRTKSAALEFDHFTLTFIDCTFNKENGT